MIKRYKAISDNFITYQQDQGTFVSGELLYQSGSNYGQTDSIVIGSNIGTTTTNISNGLVKFDIDSIVSDRSLGKVGELGSVKFYMYFTPHENDRIKPVDAVYAVKPVEIDWDEGTGTGLAYGYSNYSYGYPLGSGSTWQYAASSSLGLTQWATEGGQFDDTRAVLSQTASFNDKIKFDVTDMVEEWIDGSLEDYGVGLLLHQMNLPINQGYVQQSFAARSSEYFFYTPYIEAQWDDSKKDNRGNFQPSSSLLSAQDNTNTIYFYNSYKGELKNLPSGTPFVRLYDERTGGNEITSSVSNPLTGSNVGTGMYAAPVAIETPLETIYDRWYLDTSGSVPFYTGEITVVQDQYSNVEDQYVVKITNMKDKYYQHESPIFRVYTRKLNWNPNIYSVANQNAQVQNIEDMFYKITRVQDKYIVVNYDFSSASTKLSYDAEGSYFQFNMEELEEDYMYEIKLCYYSNLNFKEVPTSFKFRVEKDNERY